MLNTVYKRIIFVIVCISFVIINHNVWFYLAENKIINYPVRNDDLFNSIMFFLLGIISIVIIGMIIWALLKIIDWIIHG